MPNGGDGKGPLSANDRGTWPATPVSPVSLANQAKGCDLPHHDAIDRTRLFRAAAAVVTDNVLSLRPPPLTEVDPGAEVEIDAVFRRKLSGLRYLRRSERIHALRAAQDERASALRALREKRAIARHAARQLRRIKSMPIQSPTP
jgi:hypothetical protein